MRWLPWVFAVVVAGLWPGSAAAQQGVGPRTPQSTALRRDAPPRPYYGRAQRDWVRTEDPRRAGFRNPGGVGRYAEYYPPGNQFQVDMSRVPRPPASFNGGSGVPTFEQQIAAQQLGVQKYNSIQQSIDRYSRPMMGFGFGFGFGGFN